MGNYISIKSKFKLLFVVLSFTLVLALQVNATTIAENGLAQAVIVIDQNAPEPEQHAAAELADFLGQVTGAEFEIVNEVDGSESRLLVGPEAAKLADPCFSTDGLGAEGMVICTEGNDLILAGGYPRGTLYAVYTFLEDEVGCHWWASDASTIPNEPTLETNELDVNYVPVLEWRESFWYDAFDGDWAVRNKCNGHWHQLDAERGGKQTYAGWHVHTFNLLIPPWKYFAEHPEWYSLVDGVRTTTQLCLTNEEMRAELVKNLKTKLSNTPGATVASVSQNDCGGYCQCPNCVAIDDYEGSPSGSLLHFVNAVAEDIESEYPDVAITTLAYQYTRKPPLYVRPRDNVIVRLCSIECSFSVPLNDDRNSAFRDDLLDWAAICDRLYVWDYTTNFWYYVIPHPNLRVLGPNIDFFVANNVKGDFEQGAFQSQGAEMAELRAWVLAKKMWDPNLDDEQLIDQFLDGYYGPAGVHIKSYLNVIHDAVEATGDRLRCFSPIDAEFLSLDVLSEGIAHLNAAEQAVEDDPELLFRVQVAQLPVTCVFILRWYEMLEEALDTGTEWPVQSTIKDAYDFFAEVGTQKNLTYLHESPTPTGYVDLEEEVEEALSHNNPNPPHDAIAAKDPNGDFTLLTWSSDWADSYDVYFGVNEVNVTEANDPYVLPGRGNQLDNLFDAAAAEEITFGQDYYWRIDVVNEPITAKGLVWHFTAADYLLIDDFESYCSHSGLTNVWSKGGNGFIKLNLSIGKPHGGQGSMVFMYYNLDGYTSYLEANRTYGTAQDFTGYDVKALTLYFLGTDTDNGPDKLYVELADNQGHAAMVIHPDVNIITEPVLWQEWNIDLQDFTSANDVDLTDIGSVVVGIGDRYGSPSESTGEVSFDDFRLYPSRCVPYGHVADFTGDCNVDYQDIDRLQKDWLNTTTAPNDSNLLGYWRLDGNEDDSSGNGNNGTLSGTTVYGVGISGKALYLYGDEDYMTVGNDSSFNITGPFTVSAWMRKTGSGGKKAQTIVAKGGNNWKLYTSSDSNNVEFSVEGLDTPDNNEPDNPKHTVEGDIDANDGEWHHVAGVYDGSYIYVYTDGVPEVLDINDALNPLTDDNDVRLGQNQDKDEESDDYREWEGYIDEVRIYDYALSEAEIDYLSGLLTDLTDDDKINFRDYAEVGKAWLQEQQWP